MRMKKFLAFIICIIFLLSQHTFLHVNASGTVDFTVNLTTGGSQITNLYTDVEMWYYGTIWQRDWVTANSLVNKFPFVRYCGVYFATGGEINGYNGGTVTRDLLTDPYDVNSSYDFAPLINTCHNIINQGIKPYLKTGAVPVAYSNDYAKGEFNTNIRPPSNWTAYYNYMNALVAALVTEFGVNEVRTWKWGLMPEGNNAATFKTSDNNATTSRNAFFRLYDTTVAALENNLGAAHVNVGTHLWGFHTDSFWDDLDFIDHCANGTNYYTGTTGTQLDFIGVSNYENTPGNYGSGDRNLKDTIARLRNKAQAVGLDIKIGIDEGYLLFDHNGAELTSTRSVGHTWQSSKAASYFKQMLDFGYDFCARWGLTSSYGDFSKVDQGISGANLNYTNVQLLAYKMDGSLRQNTNKKGVPADSTNQLNAVSSYNSDTHKMYIMVYNHNDNINKTSSEDITVKINNISALTGSTVTVNKYIVDQTHSNFWHTWWNERGSTAANIGSKYDQVFPHTLTQAADRTYWNDNESRYIQLGELMSPVVTNMSPSSNSIALSETLAHHGVVFYEITNVNLANNISNQAIGAGVNASGTDPSTSPDYDPSFINDGVTMSNQWGSQWASASNTMPQWVELDFGDDRTINRVELFMPSGYEMRNYIIQYYRDGNWHDALPEITGNTNPHRTHIFSPITGTKLRIYCTLGDTASGYARLCEMEVYNDIIPISNKAIGAITSASSTDGSTSPDYDSSFINDGIKSSNEWGSQWASASTTMPQWVALDFGISRSMDKIEIYMPSNYVMRDYKIQYYNGSVWNDLVSITGNTSTHNTHTFTRMTASSIRVYCALGDALSGFARVCELEVYDTADNGGNLLTNPGFEADKKMTFHPIGWSVSGINTNSSYAELSSVGVPCHNNTFRMTHWNNVNYQVYTYQTKTGLVNGLYTVKAWVRSDYGNLGTAYMEAKDFGGMAVQYNIPTTSTWQQISIANINVTNGQCTVGFYSNTPANNWYTFDDVELIKQ